MDADDNVKIGGMILAAGGSSRLGHPKQLVEFEGKTLLRRAAEAIAATDCLPIVAVLGAGSETAAEQLEGLRVCPVVNLQWESGISSSIVAGLTSLLDTEPRLDAVMITLCDQPFVTAEVIRKFLLKYKLLFRYDGEHISIVAAGYNGVLGVPALFSSGLFGALMNLSGDQGARYLIRNAAAERLEMIPVGGAVIDVDTTEDVRRLSTYPHSE